MRFPHAKVQFEEYVMNIDLSQFNNVDLNEENYTTTYRMQKVEQLQVSIDTLERDFSKQKKIFGENFVKKHYSNKIKPNEEGESYFSDSLVTANLLNIVNRSDELRVSIVLEHSITDVKGILRSLENKKRNFFVFQKLAGSYRVL